ncbi:ectonucleotide pyrophosphatase/phosphodiesterase family member 7-like [Tautogolabrus adspersus]
MLLLCLAVLGLTASSPCAAAPQRDSTFIASARNKLLLISFDGFRWDYDRYVETPNLDKMAQDGVKAEYVTPPFLTITSPSHFTMLTGRHVENHGVIHNIWFNTTTQEKKQYYQTQFVDSYWDNGTLPIWITAQRQGLKAGSLHFPASAAEYRGEIVKYRQVEPPFYDHANETDWRLNIDKVVGEWLHQQDLDFVSLYFGEPDLAGHKFGPDSPECREMVRQVDRTVGYIRDKIQQHGLTDKLNIIITADHGMSKIFHGGEVQKIILSKIPGFSFKDIQFQLLDYGPVGMLLPKEGKLETVYQALKGGHPHLHVYKKEEMPARLHYSKHPRLLPIILIADPGYVVNGFLLLNQNKGEHGFDNEVKDMQSIFRAVGPDFEINKMVEPCDMVDLYPLMCHLLGIIPELHDGQLKKTEHMLVPGKDTGGDNDTELIVHEVQVGQYLFGTGNVYSVLEFIGEGVFGKVAKCKNLTTKEIVAVKILKQDKDLSEDTETEVSMLEVISVLDADRTNVVKFFECFEYVGLTCLVFEMLGKDLFNMILGRELQPLCVQDIRPIAQQLLVALDALKDLGVIHCDIKPDNIMLVHNQNQTLRVKLIDFGQAMPVSKVEPGMEIQPVGFRAPEISLGLPFNETIDVWGVGCILAFLYIANNLFPVYCEYQMMKCMVEVLGQPKDRLLRAGLYTQFYFCKDDTEDCPTWRLLTPGEYTVVNSTPTIERLHISDKPSSLDDLVDIYLKNGAAGYRDRRAFVDLLKRLLHPEGNKRISAHQALQHPFITMSHLVQCPCNRA